MKFVRFLLHSVYNIRRAQDLPNKSESSECPFYYLILDLKELLWKSYGNQIKRKKEIATKYACIVLWIMQDLSMQDFSGMKQIVCGRILDKSSLSIHLFLDLPQATFKSSCIENQFARFLRKLQWHELQLMSSANKVLWITRNAPEN